MLGDVRYKKAFEAGGSLDKEGAVELAIGKKVVRASAPTVERAAIRSASVSARSRNSSQKG